MIECLDLVCCPHFLYKVCCSVLQCVCAYVWERVRRVVQNGWLPFCGDMLGSFADICRALLQIYVGLFCRYIYMFICIYLLTHTHTHTYTYIIINTQLFIYINVSGASFQNAVMHSLTNFHCITHTHTHTHTHINIHIYTYIHTTIYIYMCVSETNVHNSI